MNMISDAPDTFFDTLKTDAKSAARLGSGLPSRGGRNDHFASVAGSLRRRGYSYNAIVQALLPLNDQLDDPLPSSEIFGLADSISRYPAGIDMPEVTEQAMAAQFADRIAAVARYIPGSGWVYFDGTVWTRLGADKRVMELAKDMTKQLSLEIERAPFADLEQRKSMQKAVKSMQRHAFLSNVQKLAATDPQVLDLERWGTGEGLLNFKNGTLVLETGEFRQHDSGDRLTQILPYDYAPDAICPHFDKTISNALDTETASFLMEILGYAMYGNGQLQRMVLVLGAGQNGKTTLIEAVAQAMGHYAKTADPGSFMKSRMQSSSANYDMHTLKGARLVRMAELNPGQALDTGLVKRFTGGEEMSARAMYSEFETFRPAALLVMVSNFAPLFDGSDVGASRRMTVIKFDRAIASADIDYDLPQKLSKEVAGIMNRLIEGLQRYQAKGFKPSSAVMEATQALIADSNQVARFLDDTCIQEPDAKTGARVLYGHYSIWCGLHGYRAMSESSFRAAMERTIGFTTKRTSAGNIWPGIGRKD